VRTPYGKITVKFGRFSEKESPVQIAPEYRDCRRAAKQFGVPLKQVYNVAVAAALDMLKNN